MGKPATKAPLAAAGDAPAGQAVGEKPAAAPAAHPAHQPVRTGAPKHTHDPGQPRDTTQDLWRNLHPPRIWPD